MAQIDLHNLFFEELVHVEYWVTSEFEMIHGFGVLSGHDDHFNVVWEGPKQL